MTEEDPKASPSKHKFYEQAGTGEEPPTSDVFAISYSTVIKIGVLLPEDQSYPFSIKLITPAVDVAVENVLPTLLPSIKVLQIVKDSNCSEVSAPIKAVDLYMVNRVHVIFGPSCDYALAPVARMSPYWNIPVLSAGASASAFKDKTAYKLLTRVHGTYTDAADPFIALANYFNWKNIGLIYEDEKGKHSDCYFRIEPLYTRIKMTFKRKSWHRSFTETGQPDTDYPDILRLASLNSRILVLCASPDVIREIMIEAHELNFDNGEFVFLTFVQNSDLSTTEIKRPWYRESDTSERNSKARKAYEALVVITNRPPISQEYEEFVNEYRKRVNSLNSVVTSIAGAFHDAVLLYGLAVKDALRDNVSIRNGTYITQQMWNRTFQGITGTVHIDENGDRVDDYSLFDMNTVTGNFEMVANYIGISKRLEFIPGRFIQWPGLYSSAPPDTPKCGFNNSKCSHTDGSDEEKSAERQAEDLLQSLQQTLTKLSETIHEHNVSLTAVTKLIQEERRKDLEESSMKCQHSLPDKTATSIDCTDILNNRYTSSGLYKIFPAGSKSGYKVLCDLETDGGGWTVFQLRENLTYDFHRLWSEYEYGFGEVYPTLNFWLGLNQIHEITSQGIYELRIDLKTAENGRAAALYQDFSVDKATSHYTISIGSFSYDPYLDFPGDALAHVNNVKFSAYDMDNDGEDTVNCAQNCKGAWWYSFCEHETPSSNLNGCVGSDGCPHLWASYGDGKLSGTRMMFRRKQ